MSDDALRPISQRDWTTCIQKGSGKRSDKYRMVSLAFSISSSSVVVVVVAVVAVIVIVVGVHAHLYQFCFRMTVYQDQIALVALFG